MYWYIWEKKQLTALKMGNIPSETLFKNLDKN